MIDQRGTPRPGGPRCDIGSFEQLPVCNDGLDNDGDGLIDCPSDIGCTPSSDVSELPALACGLGFESAPVLVGLLWLRGRRSRLTCA